MLIELLLFQAKIMGVCLKVFHAGVALDAVQTSLAQAAPELAFARPQGNLALVLGQVLH